MKERKGSGGSALGLRPSLLKRQFWATLAVYVGLVMAFLCLYLRRVFIFLWQVRLRLPAPPPCHQEVLLARKLAVGWGGSPPLMSGVDITVERGQRFLLLGPNGAGKTTLLKTLAGGLEMLARAYTCTHAHAHSHTHTHTHVHTHMRTHAHAHARMPDPW